jgi:hypothetical protein
VSVAPGLGWNLDEFAEIAVPVRNLGSSNVRVGSLSPVILGFLKGNIGLSSALALLSLAYGIGGLAILVAARGFHANDTAAAASLVGGK